jgi:hypothetical protein
MCIGVSFPGEKAAGNVKLTTDLNLMPRARMVELNLHSTICICGVVLNYGQGQLYILRVTILRVKFFVQQ